MTAQEFQARVIERSADQLAYWIETTRSDRLNWQPKTEDASDTRCALALAAECARVNRGIAELLQGRQPDHSAEGPTITTAEQARDLLRESARHLAQVVRSLDESALAHDFKTPWGSATGERLMEFPVNNMQYHGGQVNLIQLLYGDTEMHWERES